MIDKNLLRLLGDNKKYIFYAVGLMVLGLFANVGITASICWAINLAIHYDEYSGGAIPKTDPYGFIRIIVHINPGVTRNRPYIDV